MFTHYIKEKVWLLAITECITRTNVDLWPSRSRLLARAPQNSNVAAQPRAYLWAGHRAAALTSSRRPGTRSRTFTIVRIYIRAYHTVGYVG